MNRLVARALRVSILSMAALVVVSAKAQPTAGGLGVASFADAAAVGPAVLRPSAVAAKGPAWMTVPRVAGRLTARDIGLVVNTADPYSVEVGEFYAAARHLSPLQILRVELPLRQVLTPEEFRRLAADIDGHFGPSTQALALAWTQPYAVGCNSITGALALGYDATLCANGCAPSRLSRYFNSPTDQPFTTLGLRPSMLLASRNVEQAKLLIRRGVASDHTLGLRDAPPANVWFVSTSDGVRSVRARLFPPAGPVPSVGLDVHVIAADNIGTAERVLLYITGMARIGGLERIRWLPGALADHLTSFGGVLEGMGDQMSVLDWLASGATASYGTVSEPCSHLQKFPHPQALLLHYAQGSTAIEAYWKSVAWPQQGVFVGEPLAAPFASRPSTPAP